MGVEETQEAAPSTPADAVQVGTGEENGCCRHHTEDRCPNGGGSGICCTSCKFWRPLNEEQLGRVRQIVHELRVTQLPQGRNYLQETEGGFCCLGITCELAMRERWLPITVEKGNGIRYLVWNQEGQMTSSSATTLPTDLALLLRLPDLFKVPAWVCAWLRERNTSYAHLTPDTLMGPVALNDDVRLPFPLIADCIECTLLPDEWALTLAHRLREVQDDAGA